MLFSANNMACEAKRVVSFSIVAGLIFSMTFYFPIDADNSQKYDMTKEVISETNMINRYASDCIITVVKAPTDDENNSTPSKETDSDKDDTSNEETRTDENSTSETTDEFSAMSNSFESEFVVSQISFANTDTIIMHQDDKAITGLVKVDTMDIDNFPPAGIVFVSEDPVIAKVRFDYSSQFVELHYSIYPNADGETYVYAQTEDGEVCSDKIKVVVKKNEVESIKMDSSCSLERGETKDLSYELTPENPRNKTLTWTSSDESVVTVSSSGTIKAVAGGEAKITATSSNGISASCIVTVHVSQNDLYFYYYQDRTDDNKIGNEWKHITEINGKALSDYDFGGKVTLNVGDNLTFYCKSTEDDKKPDVGSKKVTHKVTEKDLINGFTVKVDVYVTENGGRYKGKTAHFVNEFQYTVDPLF